MSNHKNGLLSRAQMAKVIKPQMFCSGVLLPKFPTPIFSSGPREWQHLDILDIRESVGVAFDWENFKKH